MFENLVIKKAVSKIINSKIDWKFIVLNSKKFANREEYVQYFNNCLEDNKDVDVAWNEKSDMLLKWYDRDYYVAHNPSVTENAFLHFFVVGYKSGAYGSKLHEEVCKNFDQDFYLSYYEDLKQDSWWSQRPIEHFLMYGVTEHRAIKPDFKNFASDFNNKYYAQKYNVEASMAWVEYMLNGYKQDNDINEEYESIKNSFDEEYYSTRVEPASVNTSLYFHFISQGAYKSIAGNAWVAKLKQIFDTKFYNARYGLVKTPFNGYIHYIKYGSVRNYYINELLFKNRGLIESFDAEFYTKQYKDLSKIQDPLFHYLAHGLRERRYGSLKEKRQRISCLMPYHCAVTKEMDWMDEDKRSIFNSLTLNDYLYGNLSNADNDVEQIRQHLDNLKDTNNILVFSHCAGGGAELYLQNKITDFLAGGFDYLNQSGKINLVCLVRYDFREKKYSLELISQNHRVLVTDFDPRILLECNCNLNTIYINSIHKYPENQQENFKSFIIEVKKVQKARLVFLGHDYDLICNKPSNTEIIEELESDDFYSLSNLDVSKDISIIEQRISTQILIDQCDECLFFSQNTIDLYSKVINFDKTKVVLKPHALNFTSEDFNVQKDIKELNLKKFTVAICGNIEQHKGADIILSFAKLCLKSKIDITILIIGNFQFAPLANMVVTGSYDNDSLPEIINVYKPDCFFFSSIWAETFSYVAHDLQLSNLPILCFDLGAQAETIKEYKKGIIIDSISDEALYNAVIKLYYNYKLSQKSRFTSRINYLFADRNLAVSSEELKSLSVYLNIQNEKQDYMTWVKALADIKTKLINLTILVPETLDFDEGLSTIKDVVPNNISTSVIYTKCGNGLWSLYNQAGSSSRKVLYLSAFNLNVSVLEKWYTVVYLLGHEGCLIPFYTQILSRNDFIWLDNFIGINSKKYKINIFNSTISYMNERMEYCPLGALRDYLSVNNFMPSYIGGDVSVDSLKSMECFFNKESKVYFSDISDNIFVSLLMFSKLHDYKISVLSPKNVMVNECSNLEKLYYKWCTLNFDPTAYIYKNADIKRDAEFAKKHYTNFGFYENRDYCDYLLQENLKLAFPDEVFSKEELDYYVSYKEAAVAKYLFNLDVQGYKNLIGKQKHFVSDVAGYNDYSLSYADFKISFLVPVYNSEEFLRNCLESIYAVDYPNFEVVLCDDGSSDSSVSIIREYAQKYPENTVVVLHETNKCFAKTHKDLINASSGQFFTIIDADDYIAPNYAKIFVKFMTFYKLDVAVCSWSRPNDFNVVFDASGILVAPRVAKSSELKNSVGNWTNSAIPNIHYGLNRKCYRKETFVKCNPITIDENFAFNEDFSATLKLFTSDDLNVGFIGNRIYAWYNNVNSVSYAPSSERTINDVVFTIFNDLKDVISQYHLYEDKIITYLQKHLFAGLYQITDLFLLKKRLLLLAEKLDMYLEVIEQMDKKVITYIKANFNLLTYRLFSKIHLLRSTDKIAVIDTIGHTDLRDCLLVDLEKNGIEYFYGICSKHRTFAELFKFMEEVNSCAVIITDGGWGQDELVTKLPIINTWHGMGALKYVSRFPVSLQPTIGFSSSTDVNFCYRWMYNLPNSRIFPFGNLLASKLLDNDYLEQKRASLLSKYPQMSAKKIYLWVPTFRGIEPNYRPMQPGYNFDLLTKQLGKDELFLVKWHPCLKEFASEKLPDFSSYQNIMDVTDDDLVELMSLADVCLTDYSSCVFYASVMNVPIGIISTDVSEYQENRGFYINLRTEMPCEVFEQTDVNLLLSYIRSRSNATEQYAKFRKTHVSGVRADVAELLCKFIKSYLKNEINIY